jgi:hypothetical protein
LKDITCPECHHVFQLPLRSTGRFSQSNAEWGFSDQISRWLGDGTTKREVLVEAMVRAGIEPTVNPFGRRVFRESQITKEEASRVIDELKEIARFVGCTLIEVTEP